jgi:hypothetical protein
MPYCSSLTDSEWEIIEPILDQILPTKKQTLTIQLDKERNLGWNLLSIKEWLQLARLTQGLAPVLNRILALQAVAVPGSDRRADESLTFTSA